MSETPGADTLELTPGERLIEGAREALAIARGEIPAARITINGHAYVPETELASLRAEKEELRRERDEARQIVRDIYWMALRYADGRKSYAVGMCNDAVRKGYDGGWLKHEHPTDPAYARDGMAPEYAALGARASGAERRAEAAESLLAEAGGIIGRALEELRLIRMKDSGAVYDTTLRLEASAVATRIASLTKEPAHAE